MDELPRIPKCMSTQHPDNVHVPFFAETSELGGEDEVKEAYYVYSHLGCREQMWDCEGKEVDNFVVKKLLTTYSQYFTDRRLGEDIFLTLRVPNPQVEKAEAKILLETLESIPRSFDIAKLFYKEDVVPIFEVILPMTDNHTAIDNIYQYYADFVIGKQYKRLGGRDTTIADWIGTFSPNHINVIPLFEDKASMMKAHTTVGRYMLDKHLPYQRVFLARSDPAMNYGLVSAVLLNKIALKNLTSLQEKTKTPIYPIIGVGSAPFRGNLRPDTVERVNAEYPSAHTFTIQSAFKYDYPLDEVRAAVRQLEDRIVSPPQSFDEQRCREIMERYTEAYIHELVPLTDIINRVAGHIPGRRKRKLHIGLFGYSRSAGGITLPRAITFTAALYSIGVPPEILGLSALDPADIDFVREVYVNFDQDILDAARYMNPDSPYLDAGVKNAVERVAGTDVHEEHCQITANILKALKENRTKDLQSDILLAANIRRFLG
ncbi:MAG: phosphoenolpyruvate carboxylase [Methanoregula sp.]|nr:phosphoenolpyruvate carboxylase [Methanoregula sp.]